MNYFLLGQMIGQMTAALILPIVWLVITRIVPPLRRQIALSYKIAMVLAWPSAFLNPRVTPNDSMTTPDLLLASLAATAILYLLMLRSKKRVASTWVPVSVNIVPL
jgi:hypothetical protein